jgi:hypothetical protein
MAGRTVLRCQHHYPELVPGAVCQKCHQHKYVAGELTTAQRRTKTLEARTRKSNPFTPTTAKEKARYEINL